MVRVRTLVHTCDRCAFGTEKPATTHRTFAIDDRYYKIDLCEKHAEAFDRDLGSWTRLSTDIDNPFAGKQSSTTYTRVDAEDARRILAQSDEVRRQKEQSVLAQQQAEKLAKKAEEQAFGLIPGARKWTLTRHARERMMERGLTLTEVLMAVTMPATRTPRAQAGQTHQTICMRGDCKVVVDERTHEIITVMDRSTAWETAETARVLANH